MRNSIFTKFKKTFGILAILCAVSTASFAQEAKEVDNSQASGDYVTSTKSLKLSLLSPALTFQYEKPIGAKTVFDANLGLGVSFGFGKFVGSIDDTYHVDVKSTSIAISPLVTFAIKNYYNIDKRQEKGKNIQNNSANYFGGRAIGIMVGWNSSKSEYNGQNSKQSGFSTGGTVALAGIWGMNRSLDNNFNFNLEVGPAISLSEGEATAGAWLNIGFSKSF